MRIMVGLTRATSGTVTISGRHYADLPNPGLEVGVLLDASAQHAGRTGREILTIAQRFMGLPRRRVEEMLDLVSLTPEEASRRIRDYSLGMRQRLPLQPRFGGGTHGGTPRFRRSGGVPPKVGRVPCLPLVE
jgi:ABC-2 type transport system ATP-binding protein